MKPQRDEPVPPELLAHPDYEVIRELGRGGMGVVYLAENRLMGRKEVLKVVAADLLDRKGMLERFLREIRMAAKLNHRNIVTAYSASRVGPHLILAMEYVDGYDLGQLNRANGPVSVVHACHFIGQAAAGLQHAHERGLVHRDIKPSNLMLTRQEGVALIKIMDFGLAKANSEGAVDAGLTRSGQMLGTPYYMAPEQSIDAQKADIRADIYSLGCTLHCLLAGTPPFDGSSLYEILDAHQRREPPSLDQIRPDVPQDVAAIVSRMMAKSPADRYQTPAEVARALIPFSKKSVGASQARVSGPAADVRHAASGTLLESPVPGSRGPAPRTRPLVASGPSPVPAPTDAAATARGTPLPVLPLAAGAAILVAAALGAWAVFRGSASPPGAVPDTVAGRSSRPAPRPTGASPSSPPRITPGPIAGRVDTPAASPAGVTEPSVAGTSPGASGVLASPGTAGPVPEPRPLPKDMGALADLSRNATRTATLDIPHVSPPVPPRGTPGAAKPAVEGGAAEAPTASVARAVLSDVLSGRAGSLRGKRVRLDDVFFVGTRVDRARTPGGDRGFLHVSLKEQGVLKPLCVNSGKIEKHPGWLMLIDEAVGRSVAQLTGRYHFAPMDRPSYYAELEVTPGENVLLITGMEVLLVNPVEIAQGRYRGAFLVFHVDGEGVNRQSDVDDEYWFRKLGGPGLVAEWRNKFNRLANRQRNDAEAAANDRMLSKGMAAAAQAKAAGDFQMQAFARSKGF